MSDMIKVIGRSVVQHGPVNDRVYLMKLSPSDAPEIVEKLDRLASTSGYSKIFAKVPAWAADGFMEAGYGLEAAIPDFFPEGVAVNFLAKYFSAARKKERQTELIREVLAAALSQESVPRPTPLPPKFAVRQALEEDTAEMAAVFAEVFASYPFPIHEQGFLRTAMYDNTIYFGVWKGEKIVALSSAEIDIMSSSAEMTDFATLPEYRAHGLAQHLLQRMEKEVLSRGIRLVFTIARACSFAMNITFAKNGYRFGGTLTNNTNISGSLESMNIWYKALS